MSVKRRVIHIAHTINKSIAGARSTAVARQRHMREFIDYCFSNRLDLKDPKTVTSQVLTCYSNYLATPAPGGKGNTKGTIQNKLASVRVFLKGQGVDLQKANLKFNSAAGVGERSRSGTKQSVTDQIFEASLARAIELGEVGFAHCIRIERFLGLRGQEALMSSNALLRYAKEAQGMLLAGPREIRISNGTKGGRPRETTVIAKYAAETLRAIHDALEFASKNGGFLIAGKAPGLKAARARYHKIAALVGLTGVFAPHSLRYRYACDKLEELRDLGVCRAEAMVLAAKWLGHGPGRGRWVSMVYGQTVKDTFPKSTRRSSQKNALSQIKALIEQFPTGDSPM